MATILYFSETTLLWIVAVFFVVGIAWRSLCFLICLFRKRPVSRHGIWQRCINLLRSGIPFHKAALKRPVYAFLRYSFHVCLFVAPIWFSGHIVLWEESFFEWYWTPLPDTAVDWMTLFVLFACGFFLVRRVALQKKLKPQCRDYFLILIAGLPFLTGYCLTHGTLDNINFFSNYLYSFHIISGEIMLVMMVVLFYKVRLRKDCCVGCAACVENCPTETLKFEDRDPYRLFEYSHYQCICCGSCVNSCPEHAAELRHELKPANLVKIISKENIRKVELEICKQCGKTFAPSPQLAKLQQTLDHSQLDITSLHLCNRCKKLTAGSIERSHEMSGPS